MYKSFLWVLIIAVVLAAQSYELYPKTIEQAEELLYDGLIDSAAYDLFLSLLMSPIDLDHDDSQPLYELFDSSDIAKIKAALADKKSNLDAGIPIYTYIEPFLVLPKPDSGKEITGAVRSLFRCDSSGALASLYLRGGSERFTGYIQMGIDEYSMEMERRSVRVATGSVHTTVGSFSLPLPMGVVRPVYQTTIADSLTLLYGNGRLFNGVLNRIERDRFTIESSLSYLPTEQHVSVNVSKTLPRSTISIWGIGRKEETSLCGSAIELPILTLQSVFVPESRASLAALKLRIGNSRRYKSFRAVLFNHSIGLESLSLAHATDTSRGLKIDVDFRESWRRIRLSTSLSALVQDFSSRVSLQGVLWGGELFKWSYSSYYLQQIKESMESVNKWIQKAGFTSPVASWGVHGEGALGIYHVKTGLEQLTVKAGLFWQLRNSPRLSCIYRTGFNHLADELQLGVEARESLKNRFGFSALLRPKDMKKTKLYSALRFTF